MKVVRPDNIFYPQATSWFCLVKEPEVDSNPPVGWATVYIQSRRQRAAGLTAVSNCSNIAHNGRNISYRSIVVHKYDIVRTDLDRRN